MDIREDQADIRVSVDKTPIMESWATYAGGNLSAAGTKTRSGGMGPERSVGGPPTRDDVTVTIQMSDLIAAKHKTLEARVGRRGASVTVNYLDEDRAHIPGASFTRVGTLKSVALPTSDANNVAVGFYTLVIECDELAG